MRYSGLIWFALILPWFAACQLEEEKLTTDTNVKLRFSADTVMFDTVFTSIGSITKRLKVYNDNKNAVNISNIKLGNSDSQYNIVVNGREGSTFSNEQLMGNDSLLILVEVTINPQDSNLPFIIRDSITFETNSNLQDVKLVSWGQDANFLNDSILACNSTWTAERPYVIFNSVLVDSLCTLTIEKGAKIYSHNNSFVFVKGTLNAEGTAEERIVFRNDRLDEGFEDAPGQWGGLVFLEGTKDNNIQFADIRNAQFGIRLGSPDDNTDPEVIVGNTRIENMSNTGILAFTSDLTAYNTLVNNCAINTVGNYIGGNYIYENCTFANFSFDFFREDPAVVFSDNIVLGDNSILADDLEVSMINTIVWGNLEEELLISNGGGRNFILSLFNNVIKTTNTELDINDNILNEDPKFIDPIIYDFKLDTLSPAKDNGLSNLLGFDLEGTTRDDNPDIGAFERIED